MGEGENTIAGGPAKECKAGKDSSARMPGLGPADGMPQPYWAASPFRVLRQQGVNFLFATPVTWLSMGLTIWLCRWIQWLVDGMTSDSGHVAFDDPSFEWEDFAFTIGWGPPSLMVLTGVTSIPGFFLLIIDLYLFVYSMTAEDLESLLKRCGFMNVVVAVNFIYLSCVLENL